jgi:hypothetical protein
MPADVPRSRARPTRPTAGVRAMGRGRAG